MRSPSVQHTSSPSVPGRPCGLLGENHCIPVENPKSPGGSFCGPRSSSGDKRPSHTGSVGGLYLDTDRNRHLGVDLNGELVETHVLNRFTQYMGAIGLEPGLRSQGICHLGCPD